MFRPDRRSLTVAVLLSLVALAGVATPAVALEEDCGVDGCLDDPGTGAPEVAAGEKPFDGRPVDDDVAPAAVMPGDNTTFGAEPILSDAFQAFLKAKKAF